MERSGALSERRPTLLCLRAPDEARTMLEALEAVALTGLPLEVLRYEESWQQSADAAALAASLTADDIVVLTSRRGVRAWHNLCLSLGSGAPSTPVAAVGGATAEEALRCGFAVALTGDSDALGLAEQLAASPGAGRLVFAVARDAATEPQQLLASKGMAVVRLETYAAVPVPTLAASLSELRPEEISGIIVTSANRLEAFLHALPNGLRDAWLALPFFVIGERTAERARLLGVARVTVASGASTERLVDAAAEALLRPKRGDSE
ncbi:MAG: uroporphyrinogen-III synthase [Deltaproteobacteria bacterium]|nr:uroporphyrinogen-III synthase [Deltaproteobacteria bacterium]